MNTNQIGINKKIKDLRVAHGYTQQKIANYLNVDKTTYSHYEAGRRLPSADKLSRLALLYGLQDEMLGVSFPVEITLKYPKSMLDKAERRLQESMLLQDKTYEQLSKMLDVLWRTFEPIFKIRQEAFKLPKIPEDLLFAGQKLTVKKVCLDLRAENLIDKYVTTYKKIFDQMQKCRLQK